LESPDALTESSEALLLKLDVPRNACAERSSQGFDSLLEADAPFAQPKGYGLAYRRIRSCAQ